MSSSAATLKTLKIQEHHLKKVHDELSNPNSGLVQFTDAKQMYITETVANFSIYINSLSPSQSPLYQLKIDVGLHEGGNLGSLEHFAQSPYFRKLNGDEKEACMFKLLFKYAHKLSKLVDSEPIRYGATKFAIPYLDITPSTILLRYCTINGNLEICPGTKWGLLRNTKHYYKRAFNVADDKIHASALNIYQSPILHIFSNLETG